jgi:hypothetical protein
MSDRFFPAIDALIREAEQAAAAKPDQVRLVAELVRVIGERGADPCLLIGTLVEGAVEVLKRHIPSACRAEMTEALGRLLMDRLKAHGLI